MTDSIHQKLIPKLSTQLDDVAAAGAPPTRLHAREGAAALECRLGRVDRLACEVQSIAAGSTHFAKLPLARLQKVADELTNQLSYLEERLAVLETDDQAPEVQLRSTPPREVAEERSYFEVRVGRAGIVLQRFRKRPGAPREAVPATLTRDILLRVCGDLMSACLATESNK